MNDKNKRDKNKIKYKLIQMLRRLITKPLNGKNHHTNNNQVKTRWGDLKTNKRNHQIKQNQDKKAQKCYIISDCQEDKVTRGPAKNSTVRTKHILAKM